MSTHKNTHRAIIWINHPEDFTREQLLKIGSFKKSRSYNLIPVQIDRFLSNTPNSNNRLYIEILFKDISEFIKKVMPDNWILLDKGTDERTLPDDTKYLITYLRPEYQGSYVNVTREDLLKA